MSTSTSTISAEQGSFATDPDSTEQLWRLVAAAVQVSTAVVPGRASSTTKSSVVNQPAQPPLAPPRPGSAEFVSAALAPRGILIRARHRPFQQTAFEYFRTPKPLPIMMRAAHYRQRIGSTTLWLEQDIASVNRITTRYRIMAAVSPGLPQQEWVLEATTSLLRSDDPVHLDPKAGHDDTNKPSWLPIRLCGSFQPGAVPMTNKPQWEEPPVIDHRPLSIKRPGRAPPSSNNNRPTAANPTARPAAPHPAPTAATNSSAAAAAAPLSVAPTISYWLWADGFLRHDRSSSPPVSPSPFASSPGPFDLPSTARMNLNGLESRTPVRYGHACLPYLSVEVRDAGDANDGAAGLHWLAACGATALWNRTRLHGGSDDDDDDDNAGTAATLRHFGLLLAGCSWEVYCTIAARGAAAAASWRGCEMVHLAGGALTRRDDVEQLVDWINEIHCWGNTAYAAACVEDVLRTGV